MHLTTQALVNHTIDTVGPKAILEAFEKMDKIKEYSHNGCIGKFSRNAKFCPECGCSLRF